MYYYQRVIKSGNMVEVEIYQSIRKRSQRSIRRGRNHSLTSEKQKKANDIRAEKKIRRLILNNFNVKEDLWLTLKFYEDMTEEEASRHLDNFLRRLKYYRAKQGMSELKYIGCIECGKSAKRWHIHIVVNQVDLFTVNRLWQGLGPVHAEVLYEHGHFEGLAYYIRKDTGGTKRIRRSRNLIEPKEKVTELPKKRLKDFLAGAVPEAPKGCYLYQAEYTENEYTGTSAVYIFLPIVDTGQRMKKK